MHPSHCHRTCRDTHPDDPRAWCDGCHEDEAEDREANMTRWQDRDRLERRLAELAAEHDAKTIGADL